MYRSILLPPEVLPAFHTFICSDLTHPTDRFGCGTVFITGCTSEEKWAVVDENGRWGISHENCIEEVEPLKFWLAAEGAPVDMQALVSTHKGVAGMEMEKLKTLPINVQAGTAKLRRKKAKGVAKVSLTVKQGEEEAEGVGAADWEIVEVEAIDEDYVLWM